jgi:hypothetical protein
MNIIDFENINLGTSKNLSEIFDTNVHINVKNNRYFVEEFF